MDCAGSIDLDALAERLLARAPGGRLPLNGSIELTARCNLKCAHCYIRPRKGEAAACRRSELKLHEIRRIFDEIAEEGCLCLLLTGGEPLLRPDFPEILEYAVRKGFLVRLYTNGTLLTPASIRPLLRWRPLEIEITLYGHTKETYERVTGVPGSYARSRRSIQLLKDHGLLFALKTVVMTVNKHELGAMKAYARELGVHFRFDAAVSTRLDGGCEPAGLRLTPEEIVAIDREDEDRTAEWREICGRLRAPAHPERMYSCRAGESVFHIDAWGRLSVCLMSRRPQHSLRQLSFREGWAGLAEEVSRPWTRTSACRGCRLRPLCACCPPWGDWEHGQAGTPVDFLCRTGYLRYRGFSGPVRRIRAGAKQERPCEFETPLRKAGSPDGRPEA
jgi:radical SAM protein with 4Fe4S-binding SPASM domain